jgi:hypothetical protein
MAAIQILAQTKVLVQGLVMEDFLAVAHLDTLATNVRMKSMTVIQIHA